MPLWDRLPNAARNWLTVAAFVIGTVGGAFGLGAATGRTIEGHRDLPERVQRVEERVDHLEPAVRTLQGQAADHDYRLASLDTLRAHVGEIRCILKAQVEGANPARCLGAYR